MVDSEAILALFRRNPDEFLRQYINVHATWIHHYTPKTTEQSQQWVFEGKRAPKKTKTVKSANEVMATILMAKIMELKFELLQHPLDLAPSDFFSFPNLKKWLGGQRFTSNEKVITQTDAYFKDLPKSYFLEGFKKLEKRLEKCIELKEDYVEKWKKNLHKITYCSIFFQGLIERPS